MQINAVSLEWRSGSQDFQGNATTCGIMQLNECSEQESTLASGWHCVGHGVWVPGLTPDYGSPKCNDRRTGVEGAQVIRQAKDAEDARCEGQVRCAF